MVKKYTEDFRNYDKEARELIKGMASNQLYELYEIVCRKLEVYQDPERVRELKAVQKAIAQVPRLQPERLRLMLKGYRSEMATDARISDGSTRPNRKKV
jgi:hypothetical protein